MRTPADLRLILVLPILLLSLFTLDAQPSPSTDTCGTVFPSGVELDTLLARHQAFVDSYDPPVITRLAGLKIVPVQAHIVTLDDGTSGITLAEIQTAIGIVNMRFEPAGVIFTLCNAPNVIMSTTNFEINGYDEGDILSDLHNVDKVMNIYFVGDIFNDDNDPLCGWAYFSSSSHDYVLMQNDCAVNGSTLAHEIGHYFDLFHTHETGCGAELVDGSNCMTAGDKMCSTPADPNLSGNVNPACMYTGTDVDANMQAYLPATNNLMSYSRKDCRDNFTAEQMAKVAFTAANARSNISVLVCLDQTNYLDANCQFILPDYRNGMTLPTDCAFVDTTQVPPPGTIINTDGSTEVTITVTDANMDLASCTFTVYHIDTTSPSIAMISPDTIVTDSDCNGIIGDYRDSTVVTDNCDPTPLITQSPPPGTDIGGVGDMQTVQIMAQDFNGNVSTIDVNVTVIDAVADAQLNCRNLNLSIGLGDQVQFRLDELVPGANCSELHSITIETLYGTLVHQENNLVRNSIIAFLACDYIGQELKATVTNEAGTSAWGTLTIKQGNGPFLRGRSFELWCYDERIADLDAYHKDFDYPTAYIPCKGFVQPQFVVDWIQPYACDPEVQDTVKIIYREYEAFDKSGLRSSVFDTIVVYRIPKLHFESFFCPGNQDLYCSDTSTFATPGIIFGNPALTGFVDLIDVRTNGKDLEFFPAELDPKCGLQVKVDYWKYGQSSCEQQYKIAVEIKQSCPGTLSNLVVSVISPNSFVPLDADGTYWRCEFWVTNQDTTPPLFAPKIFNEFSCFTADSSYINDSNPGFLDILQPVIFADDHGCDAYSYLPPLCVFDDWSGVKFAKATVEGGGSYMLENDGEKCYLLDLGDDGELITLKDFATLSGGDLDEFLNDTLFDQLDSAGLLNEGSCYRSHEKVKFLKSDRPTRIFYEVYDSCHLIGRDTAYVHVKDGTPPVAIADKGLTVSLSDKKVWVDADKFDEGSWDNCGVNMILARRSDWTEACVDLCYNKKDEDCDSDSIESALCWLWTDGHDTLWTLNLEDDKHCNEVEAHYKKQLDWLCEDETSCGRLIYNSWLYDLIKYATVTCKYEGALDDLGFDKLFYRAVGNPQQGDRVRIKNEDFLNVIDTALGGIIKETFLMGTDIIEIDSNLGFLGLPYGVDIFKCQELNSVSCGNSGESLEDVFIKVLYSLLFDNCSPFLGLGPDIDIFLPAILPKDFQQDLFTQWSQIGGGWSDAVPFSCDDACGPVTVEILVMDYWCNWSTAWTKVWVEDLTPVEVAKDVVEQKAITCKVYKENNYGYPGEAHPVSIKYIIDQAQTGEQDAYDALDGIFGGYVKAWKDPYGNYVDSVGVEIECDIPFYDSICDCKKIKTQVRVYDDHLGYLWVDSLVTECFYNADTLNFQKGVVVVNCADNVHCEQEVWSDFDHCGQGYIFRKFKIWQGCPAGSYEGMPDSLRHPVDTIYRHQRIWVGNECDLDKYMFDVPYDTAVVSCNIEYGPDGNVIGDAGPENTGYARYKFDDDCRLVGIAHEDKVFKIVGGEDLSTEGLPEGMEACYKILRTWYFADWCGSGTDAAVAVPTGKWWLDERIITDKCVQKIIVRDTVAPICTITGPVDSGDSVSLAACDYDLAVTVDASDACGVISYYWELKDITREADHTLFDSGAGQLDGAEEGTFDIASEGLYPGTYKLKVQIKDDCANESYCEYIITVTSGKKPSPVCLTSITARLTPWDSDDDGEVDTAHAIIWAYEYDRSSEPACEDDSLEYRLEMLDGSDDDETFAGDLDFLEVGCDDIGTHIVRFWVISHPSGSSDYCDAVLIVQSDGSGCPTTANGERVVITDVERDTITKSSSNKEMSAGDVNFTISGDAFGSGTDHFQGYNLYQNSPNPFKYETQIGFTLPESMGAKIEVYDMTGRLIKTISGSYAKGYNTVLLTKADLRNLQGLMYYRLSAGVYLDTKRMILIE